MVTLPSSERRRHPRFNLAPMYSEVVARLLTDDSTIGVPGHAYNISEGGVRIESEGTFHVGQSVHLDITLPGTFEEIHASGKIVWIMRGDDDPAARRMAVQFERFDAPADQWRLMRFIQGAAVRRLAA